MIYRVILKNGYYEIDFDFDSIEEAGKFASTILMHQVPNEDNAKKSFVSILVIDATNENKEDEE